MSYDTAHQTYVDRLRRFVGDHEATNILNNNEESNDDFLHDCIEDALDDINFYGPRTSYTFSSIIDRSIPWNLVKIGATLQILTGKGILSARNVLSYNDAGGVQVSDYDVYGRYINYYNLLVTKFFEMLRQFKVSDTINNCYGEFGSELNQEGWYY